MPADPPIPDDHPIRRVWRYNEKLQSIAGKIELAQNGDPYAARQLLALYVTLVRRRERCPTWRRQDPIPIELEAYIADRVAAVLNGENAAAALLVTTGKKGGTRLTSKEEQDRALVGFAVAERMEDGENYDVAAEAVAKEYHVSESTAKLAYRTYIKVKTK